MKALVSWSGGKDSCYAAIQAKADGYTPVVLLGVMNEGGKISRSHGVPANILQAQAHAAGIPIVLISSSWEEYEQHFTAALTRLRNEYALTHAIFGDIDLQGHLEWEEKVCNNASLTALLPLWLRKRKQLVLQMLDTGRIETMIVSCNVMMGERFLGQRLTPALVEELEALGIDPCGENGEFHTLVLNCPLFSKAISVRVLNKLRHEQYWFCELTLINE